MNARPEPDPVRARVRMGVGAAFILLLVGLGCAVILTAVTPHGASAVIAPGPSRRPSSTPEPTPTEAAIFVHVLGQVARPGLYRLPDGDRAVDAIAAAGGFAAHADPAGVNLARLLSDGEQLVIPKLGQAVPTGATGGSGSSSGKVNLNTADAAALETLPRVGPAMAQKIIAWRQANGRFASVDDLLAVSGIGAKTLESLRPLVTT